MNKSLRFAILYHTDWPEHANHFDLMLQTSEGNDDDDVVLKTFSTLNDKFPERPCELKLIQDHRRYYLTYEGGLSGGRGSVRRVDCGELIWIQMAEPLQFELSGKTLNGKHQISSVKGRMYLEKIHAGR